MSDSILIKPANSNFVSHSKHIGIVLTTDCLEMCKEFIKRQIYFSLSEIARIAILFMPEIIFKLEDREPRLSHSSIRLPEQIFNQINILSDKTNISRSFIIDYAIKAFLHHPMHKNINFITIEFQKRHAFSFKMPILEYDEVNKLIKEKYFRSRSEFYRIAITNLLFSIEENNNIILECEKYYDIDNRVQTCVKMPNGFIILYKQYVAKYNFSSVTEFLIYAIRKYLQLKENE